MAIKLRRKIKPSMTKNVLSPTDVLLMAMLNFPQGAVGEHNIHIFVKEIIETPAFEHLADVFAFVTIGGLPFSPPLHRSIVENTKDLSTVDPDESNTSDETTAMFSDGLRFDLYDEVVKIEYGYAKLLTHYSPKVFMLSAMGRSIAILSLRERLTKEQKAELSSIAKIYSIN